MIITIGREFGSGGREMGKRLADALGIPCYDKEIINEVAKLHNISPERVDKITQSDIMTVYPGTIGRTFSSHIYYNDSAIKVMSSQYDVIKRLASEGDAVFVGRNADVVLKEYNTFNIFVYADSESKLKRCMARSEGGETEKEILKAMKKINKDRASNRRLMTDDAWGKKESYHLCIDTSGRQIKALVPFVAEYIKAWFAAE